MICPYCNSNIEDSMTSLCPECGLDFKTGRKFVANINPLGVKLPFWSSITQEDNAIVIKMKNSNTSNYIIFAPLTIFFILSFFGVFSNLDGITYFGIMLTFIFIGLGIYLFLDNRVSTVKIDDRQVYVKTVDGQENLLSSSSITQIYCELVQTLQEHIRIYRRHYGFFYLLESLLDIAKDKERKYSVHYSFSIIAKLENGSEAVILDNIKSALTAQFIEEKIEEKLGIINLPLPNEYESIAKRTIAEMKFKQYNELETNPIGGVDWSDLNGHLTIKRKWHAPKNLTLMIVLNALTLIFLFNMNLYSSLPLPEAFSCAIAIMLQVCVNIYAITLFSKNTTKINVDNMGIDVTVYPIFYPGNFRIEKHQIEDLYVTDTLMKNNMPEYNIVVKLSSGNKYRLMSDIKQLSEAQLLVYKIKCKLGKAPLML